VTGLRDRKKREVRHRIIAAAAAQFASRGLDTTTMEDIADAADVSVGTVYNYFGNKSALLLAGVEEDTTRMIEAGAAVLADPGDDPVTAVQRLAGIYLSDMLSWDRRLLREVLGAAFQRIGGEELTLELARMDERLIAQMMTLLGHFHAAKKLRPDVEIFEASILVFSVFVLQLFMFISMEGFEPSQLHAQVDRQIELAFAGLAKPTRKKATSK
jgi:AcrR family transcriptional regulator